MIEVLKTKNEYIYAFIEWFRIDENGIPCDKGKKVHIYDLWIHPSKAGDNSIIPKFQTIIKPKCIDCTSLTFERTFKDAERYGKPKIREFSRRHFFKGKGGRVNEYSKDSSTNTSKRS